MGLFDSKANIAQIIKEENTGEVFIWKAVDEDFNTGTQLIVHESQEAIFFMNGQVLDLFGAGRHTLETQNIPLLKRALNWATNGENAFHCELYYINKVEQMAIKWGTDSKIEYLDPEYHFPIAIGASGEMALQAEDSRKLLLKLVGTGKKLTKDTVVQYFRGILQMKVKSGLAKLIKKKAVSIFEVDEYLDEFSIQLQEMLEKEFKEYGVRLCNFVISVIQKPEDDRNFVRFKELHIKKYTDVEEAKLRQQVGLIEQETAKQKMILEAEGISAKRRLEGYTYQDERGYDVAEKIAENEAKGEFANLGIGMGLMAGMGGGLAMKTTEMAADAMKQVQTTPTIQTGTTSTMVQNTNMQENAVTEMDTFKQKVEKLKVMKDSSILSEEEFLQQKQRLLELL